MTTLADLIAAMEAAWDACREYPDRERNRAAKDAEKAVAKAMHAAKLHAVRNGDCFYTVAFSSSVFAHHDVPDAASIAVEPAQRTTPCPSNPKPSQS